MVDQAIVPPIKRPAKTPRNLLNDTVQPGASRGSFGNEQIAHVLLDEMTAVHGKILRVNSEAA